MAKAVILEQGRLSFTVESRILRELGERLVKQPDVALLELIKNAYDADARNVEIAFGDNQITITDDGHGMSEADFVERWMRMKQAAGSVLSNELRDACIR